MQPPLPPREATRAARPRRLPLPSERAPVGPLRRLSARHLVGAGALATLLAVAATARAPVPQESVATDGLITLYQHDDLASSLDFRSGAHGGRVLGGQLDLSAAQLAYGTFEPGLLAFGFVADEAVQVVDLGPQEVEPTATARDLALKAPLSVFHTLGFAGRRLTYLSPQGSYVRLGTGNAVFDVPRQGLQFVEPIVGHSYAVRYQRTRGDRSDMLAKFLVVEHRPGESVTLRFGNIGPL